jgi:hypothetical protein
MSHRTIPGMSTQYALINFDKDGNERTDDAAGGRFSERLIEQARTEKPTDIFLFSHGWKGDVGAAVDQYDRWIGAMWKLEADRTAMGADFKPLLIGLHWPSLPWGEEKLPAAANFAANAVPDLADAVAAPEFEDLYEYTVQHFGDAPQVRDALRVIFEAQKSDPGALEVPAEALAAYQQLAGAIGFSAGGGADAPPDAEGAPLDPDEAVRADRAASTTASFGGGGGFFKGILGGLRQLSFWTMKHRARTVGEGGMHQFVAAMQDVCDAQVHLMGHSFGCIVMSSIVHGPNGKSALKRPINSVALVQGAFSLWSFGDHVHDSRQPGYFHRILKEKRVTGSIVTTQSVHDTAVGTYYPAAVGLVGEAVFAGDLPKFGAVGAFGIQGTTMAQPRQMLDHQATYGFKPGGVYNVESSKFIKKLDGSSGAHSDIDGPEVAHMLWQAAQTTGRVQRV